LNNPEDIRLVYNNIIQRQAIITGREAEAGSSICLWVCINQKHPCLTGRQEGGNIDNAGRFAYPAFLVSKRKYEGHSYLVNAFNRNKNLPWQAGSCVNTSQIIGGFR
jgi:hypothetical protein